LLSNIQSRDWQISLSSKYRQDIKKPIATNEKKNGGTIFITLEDTRSVIFAQGYEFDGVPHCIGKILGT